MQNDIKYIGCDDSEAHLTVLTLLPCFKFHSLNALVK